MADKPKSNSALKSDIPNPILKSQYDLLEFAAQEGKYTTIKRFQDHYPYSYSLANSTEKILLGLNFIRESPTSTRLLFKITPKGTQLLKACKNGTVVVKNNAKKKASGSKELVTQSSHDTIAESYIAAMALPVTMNSQLNNCLSSVYGIVSDFLAEFPSELPDATKLDKHNQKLFKLIQSINKKCEAHHGETSS